MSRYLHTVWGCTGRCCPGSRSIRDTATAPPGWAPVQHFLTTCNLQFAHKVEPSYSGPAVGFMVLFIALNLLNCSNVTSNMDQTLELAWLCMDSEYTMLSSCNKRVRDNFPQI